MHLFHWQERHFVLAWLDYAWVIKIVNVLVRNKIRTRHLPPPPLPNIVRIAMHIDIYGRSLNEDLTAGLDLRDKLEFWKKITR